MSTWNINESLPSIDSQFDNPKTGWQTPGTFYDSAPCFFWNAANKFISESTSEANAVGGSSIGASFSSDGDSVASADSRFPWFLDYENGSDNNSGDSFAVTLTNTDGFSDGTTTFTSASGGFTGMAGRKIFIITKGGRSISSVVNDTTVILNAIISSGSGLTFTIGGRRKTINSMTGGNCQGLTGSHVIRHIGSPQPTSLGIQTAWSQGQNMPNVMLLGSSNYQLAKCDTAWQSANTNITCGLSTDSKEGGFSASLVSNTNFSTGVVAYWYLGDTPLDLSNYQILTFWFKQTSGTSITSANTIRLCSDDVGQVPVHTLTIPSLTGTNFNVWMLITIDNAAVFSSSIKSISFSKTSNQSMAFTFLIDDVRVWSAANLTKTISMNANVWTAATNVTTSTTGTRKEGALAASISSNASFTTGLMAYYPLGTTENYSSYNQVSFWIQQSSGTLIASNQLSLRLCSDTVGAITVNTITIPPLTGSTTGVWHCFTVDTGGALGSSIQSIALYADSTFASRAIILDCIIACLPSSNDASLSLSSLIGQSNSIIAGGDDSETFYGIRSINANTVVLDMHPGSTPATTTYGYHTSVITTGYKQETSKTAYVSSGGTSLQQTQLSGSSGNLIALEGGWDRTSMSRQSLISWLDTSNGLAAIINFASQYWSIDKFGCIRGDTGLYVTNTFNTINGFYGANNTTAGLYVQTASNTINKVNFVNNNANYGVFITGGTNTVVLIDNANNNSSYGVLVNSASNVINTINNIRNNLVGVNYFAASNTTTLINNAIGNSTYGVYTQNGLNTTIGTIKNCNHNGNGGLQASRDTLTITLIENCNYNGSFGMTLASNAHNIGTITNCNYNLSQGVLISGSNSRITTITNIIGNYSIGLYFSNCYNTTIETVSNVSGNVSFAVMFNSSHNNKIDSLNITGSSNNTYGLYFSASSNNTLGSVSSINNSAYGVMFANSHNNIIASLTTSGNPSASIGEDFGSNFIKTATMTDPVNPKVVLTSPFSNAKVFIRYSSIDNNTFHIFADGGDIREVTDQRHTASGIAWKLSPSSTNRSVTYPLEVSLVRFTAVANTTYTVTCYTRRDSASITSRLICKKNQLSGITSDVIATSVEPLDTWGGNGSGGPLSISFTPTESGVIEIHGQAYGGTTLNVWFDDLTVNNIAVSMDYTNLFYGPGAEPLISPGISIGRGIISGGSL